MQLFHHPSLHNTWQDGNSASASNLESGTQALHVGPRKERKKRRVRVSKTSGSSSHNVEGKDADSQLTFSSPEEKASVAAASRLELDQHKPRFATTGHDDNNDNEGETAVIKPRRRVRRKSTSAAAREPIKMTPTSQSKGHVSTLSTGGSGDNSTNTNTDTTGISSKKANKSKGGRVVRTSPGKAPSSAGQGKDQQGPHDHKPEREAALSPALPPQRLMLKDDVMALPAPAESRPNDLPASASASVSVSVPKRRKKKKQSSRRVRRRKKQSGDATPDLHSVHDVEREPDTAF